jgi:hypothetical protein
MTNLNVPNSSFDHHCLLDFGLMIPNPQPCLMVLMFFFPHDLVVKTWLIGLD